MLLNINIRYISHYLRKTALPVLIWMLGALSIASAQEPADTICVADTVEAPRPRPDIPEPAVVGIAVRELSSGIDIAERNIDTPLSPASILKCVTAACAIADGKATMRFETSAHIRGAVKDRQLWGDLVIMASGDPTTDSAYFPANTGLADSIAARIALLGIDSIRGQIVFDASLMPGGGPSPHWLPEDYKWSYGAGHYALNYRDNTLPPDKAMPDPTGYFYDALEKSLSARGIEVLDEDIDIHGTSREIYRRHSPAGREIMRSMMVRSDNMFAEAMLRSLAPGDDVKNAISREHALLARLGLSTREITLHDGSGLARDNRVTPRFMATLLQQMASSPYAGEYISLFPKAGEEGTVRRLLSSTPLAGQLVLKSGSMRGVQCYAGYKLNDNGEPTHAVVVIVNKFNCPRSTVVKQAEEFLLETFMPETLIPQTDLIANDESSYR